MMFLMVLGFLTQSQRREDKGDKHKQETEREGRERRCRRRKELIARVFVITDVLETSVTWITRHKAVERRTRHDPLVGHRGKAEREETKARRVPHTACVKDPRGPDRRLALTLVRVAMDVHPHLVLLCASRRLPSCQCLALWSIFLHVFG